MNAIENTPVVLSAEQRRAVEASGPLLVDAPPGGGKTSVLAHRVAHLVHSGAAPFGILALAFSVRAARELRDRLDALLAPEQSRLISACTFHALGLRLLRESGHALGYPRDERHPSPVVCAPEHARAILRTVVSAEVAAERAAAAPRLTEDALAGAISAHKIAGAPPPIALAAARDPAQLAVARIYAAYQAALLRDGLVDFDDLILQPLTLLEADAEALRYYQARWQHVLVDEFQDVSPAQYRLARLLAREHRSLTAIGDPDQSIYGFRGGMGGAGFERFRADFPEYTAVALPHNYRSTRNIIALATAVLAPARAQVATKPPGLPVYLFPANSEHQEAEVIAEQLIAAAAAGFARYDQCAVLCRTHALARLIEAALVRRRVPCVVAGAGSFFDHAEVRALCACLRLARDFDDSLALQHLLDGFGWLSAPARKRMRGDDPDLRARHLFERERVSLLPAAAQAEARAAQAALLRLDERQDLAPAELIAFALADDGLGYSAHVLGGPDGAERLDRIDQLAHLARTHARAGDFLDELDAMSGYDPLALAGRDRVGIMTLHAAKGLEFKLAFVAGLEDGLIPHAHAAATERGRREELRLLYVGLTRASDALCLTFARARDGRPRQSSPWLRGLPNVELRHTPDWHQARGAGQPH